MGEGQRPSAVEKFSEALGCGSAGCGVFFLGLLIIVLALGVELAVVAHFAESRLVVSCLPASSLCPTIHPKSHPIDYSKKLRRHLETPRSSFFEVAGYHEASLLHRRGSSLLECDRMLHPSLVGTCERK